LVFPCDPTGVDAQRHEKVHRNAWDLGLTQDAVAQTAAAARKHQTRLRVRNRERGSRCQALGGFIKLRFAPSGGRPLVFDATENDDAIDVCGRRPWRKLRLQRAQKDLADREDANSQERGERGSAAPRRQTPERKTSGELAHDHASCKPGLDLQSQPYELGEDEERRVHRDADQLRCGRTRNWRTFERFLNASV
jgi:hypothetical protein